MRIYLILVWLIVAARSQEPAAALIELGDRLRTGFETEKAYEAYREAFETDSLNAEAAWKTARQLVDLAALLDKTDAQRGYYLEAERWARKTIRLDSLVAPGYTVLAVSLGRLALYEGGKQKIKLSRAIRKNAEKAMRLDSMEHIAYHVMGRWNRAISTLSWLERTFANMLLGGVPKNASLENAVRYFREAGQIAPYYMMHRHELGKTYAYLEFWEKARAAFSSVLGMKKVTIEDDRVRAEARHYIQLLDERESGRLRDQIRE